MGQKKNGVSDKLWLVWKDLPPAHEPGRPLRPHHSLPWPPSPVRETTWTLQLLDFVSAALGFEQQTGMMG